MWLPLKSKEAHKAAYPVLQSGMRWSKFSLPLKGLFPLALHSGAQKLQECGRVLTQHAAAAAAKSLQSCLCATRDGRPPGSPVPGILHARTLEWIAISFSSAWKWTVKVKLPSRVWLLAMSFSYAWKWKVKVKLPSRVWLLATPCTAAHQAPPSKGLARQEYWRGLPLPSPWSRCK